MSKKTLAHIKNFSPTRLKNRRWQNIKQKKKKPKKPTLRSHKNFTCDKCGEEFQDETSHSYASNLVRKLAKTYCGDCVKSIN